MCRLSHSTHFSYTTLFRSQAKVRLDVLEKSVSVRTEQLQATNAQLQAEIAERKGVELALRQSQEAIMQQERMAARSEEHTSELQSHSELVCRLLLEKKKKK